MLITVIIVLFSTCYAVSSNTNEAISKGMINSIIEPDSLIVTKQDSVYYLAYQKAYNQLRKDNAELISNCVQSWNSNMTLWMSLICAVCTLLPIASNLYYSNQIQDVEKRFMKHFNDEIQQLSEKMEQLKMNKDELTLEYDIISLSSVINTCCDMQDLFQRHCAMLTDTQVVEKTIAILDHFIKESQELDNITQNGKLDNRLMSSYYFLLLNYDKLLTTYESIFDYPRLLRIFGTQEYLKRLIDDFDNHNPESVKPKIESITKDIIRLFEEEMLERNPK